MFAEIHQSNILRQTDLKCVKILRILLLVAVCEQEFAHINGLGMNLLCNASYAFSSMINAIHTGHHSIERFCRTDIRGSFLALDMLLARLQCEAVSGFIVGIFRETNDATRQFAFILISGGHIACSRTTKAHRQAETLCRTANDISTPTARRLQESERHQVGNYRQFQSGSMQLVSPLRIVFHRTISVRPLHDSTKIFGCRFEILPLAHYEFNALAYCARAHNR